MSKPLIFALSDTLFHIVHKNITCQDDGAVANRDCMHKSPIYPLPREILLCASSFPPQYDKRPKTSRVERKNNRGKWDVFSHKYGDR